MRLVTAFHDITIYTNKRLLCFELIPGEKVELEVDEAAAFIAALQENLAEVKSKL